MRQGCCVVWGGKVSECIKNRSCTVALLSLTFTLCGSTCVCFPLVKFLLGTTRAALDNITSVSFD